VREITTILFIDSDEASFRYRLSVADQSSALADVDLLLATNSEEALEILETQRPDVLIVSDELMDDYNFLAEFCEFQNIPVIVQSDSKEELDLAPLAVHTVTTREVSQEEIHQTLSLAVSMKIPDMGLMH